MDNRGYQDLDAPSQREQEQANLLMLTLSGWYQKESPKKSPRGRSLRKFQRLKKVEAMIKLSMAKCKTVAYAGR